MKVVFLLHAHLYYTSELANALAHLGHDVALIVPKSCPSFSGSGSGTVVEDFRALLDPRVVVEWIDIPARTAVTTIPANLKCIADIVRLIRKHKPDVLHLHDVADYRIFAALRIAKKSTPLVLTVHDAALHPGYSRRKVESFRPRMRRLADAIIVHGKDIRQRLLDVNQLDERKVHCVPHGAYTLYRRWLSSENKACAKQVLFFGRVLKYKGLQYFIEAAPIVCSEISGVKFVIAGSGPDWPACRSMIQNPDDFVLIDAYVYDPDVTKLFQQSAVVVLPYVEASQSGVLAIAYALGKPVVVTNIGSLPEVVEHGKTGLLVPPRDATALAEAILTILKDDALRAEMAENAYQRAETDLSWDSVARQTVDVYADMGIRGARQ